MPMSKPTVPDDIYTVAQDMIAATEIGDAILVETIESAVEGGGLRESGRTWCSTDGEYDPPVNRYPAAVDLNGCPAGDITAVWHTHTSESDLRNPTHSLPDFGNVISGSADVSIVSGVESDHVLMGTGDADEMLARFENALGVELDAATDVGQAVKDGRIASLRMAREAVAQEFEPQMARVDADRPQLRQAVDDLFDPDTPTVTESTCEGFSEIECDPDTPGGDRIASGESRTPPQIATRAPTRLREETRSAAGPLTDAMSRFDLVDTVVGTAVGMFTSRLLERAVFGD